MAGGTVSSYLTRYVGLEQLPRKLSDFDVDVYFRLPEATLEAIKQRFQQDRLPRATDRQVGLAVQLVYLRTTGRVSDRMQVVPPALLRYLGRALKVPAPSITSLQAIYRRRPRTLYDHQQWAKEHLGLTTPGKAELAELTTSLKAQAGEVASVEELIGLASLWLFENKQLIPAARTMREMAVEAFAAVERDALRVIKTNITSDVVD